MRQRGPSDYLIQAVGHVLVTGLGADKLRRLAGGYARIGRR